MENRASNKLGMGKANFLSQIDNIRADIDRGITLRAILKTNQELTGMSYASFCHYVRTFITDVQRHDESTVMTENSNYLEEGELVEHTIIVPRKFRQLFRLHAANIDLSEYEFLRMLVDDYEAQL
jgi:hypothetical protein